MARGSADMVWCGIDVQARPYSRHNHLPGVDRTRVRRRFRDQERCTFLLPLRLLIRFYSRLAICLSLRSCASVRFLPFHLMRRSCLPEARSSLPSLRHHPIPRIHLVHTLIYPIRAFSRTQDIRDVTHPHMHAKTLHDTSSRSYLRLRTSL